jgi:hypothetical protein
MEKSFGHFQNRLGPARCTLGKIPDGIDDRTTATLRWDTESISNWPGRSGANNFEWTFCRRGIGAKFYEFFTDLQKLQQVGIVL